MTDHSTPPPDDMTDDDALGATSQSDGSPLPQDAAPIGTVFDAESIVQELAEEKDKYLRLYAEFENSRRRAVRDRQDAEHRGMANMLRGTLDVLDDIARVAHVDPATTDAAAVVAGIAIIEKKLLKSLGGHGLEVVHPVGQPFDPALHEAITTSAAATEQEDHTVAQVYQVGYVFNGMLLRPARVVVLQWNG